MSRKSKEAVQRTCALRRQRGALSASQKRCGISATRVAESGTVVGPLASAKSTSMMLHLSPSHACSSTEVIAENVNLDDCESMALRPVSLSSLVVVARDDIGRRRNKWFFL